MELKKGYIGVYLDKNLYCIKSEAGYKNNASGQFLSFNPDTTTIDFSEIKIFFPCLNNIFFIKKDGTLWGNGSNYRGMLGINNPSITRTKTPMQINLSNVKSIVNGSETTLFITEEGFVYGCGSNRGGWFGNGTTNQANHSLVKLPIDDIKKGIISQYNIVFLKNDGTVWGAGENGNYVLGTSNSSDKFTSFKKLSIDNVIDICDVENGVIFLKYDRTVWACGYSNGLGLPSGNYYTPKRTNVSDAKKIYAGFSCSFVIKNDNTVWVSGETYNGRLGIKNAVANYKTNKIYNQHQYAKIDVDGKNIEDIVVNESNTYILKKDHTVWGCGNNEDKRLGNMDEYEVINHNNDPIVEEFQKLKLPNYRYNGLIGDKFSRANLFTYTDYLYPSSIFTNSLKEITKIQTTDISIDKTNTSTVSLKIIINNQEPIMLNSEMIDNTASFDLNPELLKDGINTLKATLIDSNEVPSDNSFEFKVLKTRDNLIQFPKAIITKEVMLDKTYDRIKVDTINNGNIKLIYKIKEEYIENENIAEDLELDKAQLIILLDNDTEVKCYQQKAFNNIKVYF